VIILEVILGGLSMVAVIVAGIVVIVSAAALSVFFIIVAVGLFVVELIKDEIGIRFGRKPKWLKSNLRR